MKFLFQIELEQQPDGLWSVSVFETDLTSADFPSDPFPRMSGFNGNTKTAALALAQDTMRMCLAHVI